MAIPENTSAAALQPAWWMTNEMLAQVSWWGLALTSAGLILGVIAFWITLVQLRKTKGAAYSARSAAESVRKYYSYISSAYVSSQIGSLIQSANNNDYKTTQTSFIHVKHLLRMKVIEIGNASTTASDLKRSIAIIDNQLILAIAGDPKFKFSSLQKSLDKIHALSSAEEANSNAKVVEKIQ